MARFIHRAGIPVAVPADYASQPDHVALVTALTAATQYDAAVTILEHHAVSWLAADILSGAPWAQKFLTSTARLYYTSPRHARRGLRALMAVLHGTPLRVGRRRAPVLPPMVLAQAAEVGARWRAVLDGHDRTTWASAVVATQFPFSKAHLQALHRLGRQPKLRKHDLVLTLVSWETGLPVRCLRTSPTVYQFVCR